MNAQPLEVWPDEPVPLTEDEFDALPGHDRHRYEIIDGELYVNPPAGDSHQNIAGALRDLLRAAAPKGWRRVRTDVFTRVPDARGLWAPDVLVPRPGTQPVDDKWNATDLALAVEVASNSTADNDRTRKLAGYARSGVEAYWRVERDLSGWPIFFVHTEPDKQRGSYRERRTVWPNERYEVTVPFPFTIDAAAVMAIVEDE